MADLDIQPLASFHERAAFACGVESLDRYIGQQAGQDQRRDLAVCYVLAERNSPDIIGYYTLSATSIAPVSIPPQLARKYGRYGVLPAPLLGRLAVDMRHRSKGMGALLLYNALRRTLRSGIASMAIVVDAVDENAVAFYERYGFRRFEDDPARLYLTMSSVRDIFPGDEGSNTDRLEQWG